LDDENHLASRQRILQLALSTALHISKRETLFMCRLFMLRVLNDMGSWLEAEEMWNQLEPMGRNWSRAVYRPGWAEYDFALFKFRQGQLKEEYLLIAEKLANEGKNRGIVRYLHSLRGIWLIEKKEWQQAISSLNEAVNMARAIEQVDANAETWLALAKFYCGQLADAVSEAERLSNTAKFSSRPLAELWLAIGNPEEAKKHALAAYEEAWADGEPYVYRYELTKSAELLARLGVELPILPPYDPAKDIKFDWEDKVVAIIEELKAEKEKKDKEE
jgi:tetratricopeptide (TPR) repeat protein